VSQSKTLIQNLITEQKNVNSIDIDLMESADIISLINDEDSHVIKAINAIKPEISQSVDAIVEKMKQGGRLIYLGAGTSGRLGVLDAVEIEPTFGVSPDSVFAIIAGGKDAMFKAQEGCEDNPDLAIKALKEHHLSPLDSVIGIAASGQTPFVVGALKYAQSLNCTCVAISCNPDALINQYAEFCITPIVGPEVIRGSTRMKARRAQKMVLNMISTATMVKLGKTYQNLMVDVKVSNQKLNHRAIEMLMELTEITKEKAELLLSQSHNQVKVAIMMQLSGLNREKSRDLLNQNDGFIRKALSKLSLTFPSASDSSN